MGEILGSSILLGVLVLVFVLGLTLGAGGDHVEAGVGRTFQCEEAEAVKVGGDYIKGETCRAVDK